MRLARTAALLAPLLAPLGTWAHGELFPQRGGVAAWSRELSVEVVVRGEEVDVYVDDHGAAVSVADAKGHVILYRGEELETVPLVAQTDGKLLQGRVKSAKPSDRIQVVVTFADGRLVFARLNPITATAAKEATVPAAFATRLNLPQPVRSASAD